MPSDTQLPPKGPRYVLPAFLTDSRSFTDLEHSKPNQLHTPRGEKRNAVGTIKEQLGQVSHSGMAAGDTTLPSDTLVLAPEGQDRDMSEFSGGYDTEGEFGADEMEEDEEEDEEDESERDDEDKQQDTEGKKKGKRPDRDFGPGNGNGNGYGNGGDAGDDGYEGDSDDSGASTDCNFDDDESDGAPVFEPNNDGEVPSLDSVDPRTFGGKLFDIPNEQARGQSPRNVGILCLTYSYYRDRF